MNCVAKSSVTTWPLRTLLAWLLVCPWPAHGAELTIAEISELDFGSVVDRSGNVSVGLNNDVIFDPFNIHVGNPVTTGIFHITGDPFSTFSISVIGSTISGLSIGSFNTSEGSPPVLNASLNALGQLDLRLGADVTVNSAQATPGLNQPLLFTIIMNYN